MHTPTSGKMTLIELEDFPPAKVEATRRPEVVEIWNAMLDNPTKAVRYEAESRKEARGIIDSIRRVTRLRGAKKMADWVLGSYKGNVLFFRLTPAGLEALYGKKL